MASQERRWALVEEYGEEARGDLKGYRKIGWHRLWTVGLVVGVLYGPANLITFIAAYYLLTGAFLAAALVYGLALFVNGLLLHRAIKKVAAAPMRPLGRDRSAVLFDDIDAVHKAFGVEMNYQVTLMNAHSTNVYLCRPGGVLGRTVLVHNVGVPQVCRLSRAEHGADLAQGVAMVANGDLAFYFWSQVMADVLRRVKVRSGPLNGLRRPWVKEVLDEIEATEEGGRRFDGIRAYESLREKGFGEEAGRMEIRCMATLPQLREARDRQLLHAEDMVYRYFEFYLDVFREPVTDYSAEDFEIDLKRTSGPEDIFPEMVERLRALCWPVDTADARMKEEWRETACNGVGKAAIEEYFSEQELEDLFRSMDEGIRKGALEEFSRREAKRNAQNKELDELLIRDLALQLDEHEAGRMIWLQYHLDRGKEEARERLEMLAKRYPENLDIQFDFATMLARERNSRCIPLFEQLGLDKVYGADAYSELADYYDLVGESDKKRECIKLKWQLEDGQE